MKIGANVKERYKKEFEELKAPFVKAMIDFTPKHLRKLQAFGLQYLFCADGCFLLCCIQELLGKGKLKLPTEEQRGALMTVVTTD